MLVRCHHETVLIVIFSRYSVISEQMNIYKLKLDCTNVVNAFSTAGFGSQVPDSTRLKIVLN
jgi:hypothetical protein